MEWVPVLDIQGMSSHFVFDVFLVELFMIQLVLLHGWYNDDFITPVLEWKFSELPIQT